MRLTRKLAYTFLLFLSSVCFAQQPKLMLPTGHAVRINDMAVSNDGSFMASASDDRTVILWETKTGRQLHTLVGHTNAVNKVWFSTDDKYIFSSSSKEHAIYVWDKESAKLVKKIVPSVKQFSDVKTNANKTVVYITDFDGSLYAYKLPGGTLLFKTQAHKGIIQTMHLSGDYKKIVTAGDDKKVNQWDAGTGKLFKQLDLSADSLYFLFSARYSPDNNKIIVAYSDTIKANGKNNTTAKVKIVEAVTGKTFKEFTGGYDRFEMEYTADGKKFIRLDYTGSIQVSDVATGKKIMESPLNYGNTYGELNKGNIFYAGGNTLSSWNIKSGKMEYSIKTPFTKIQHVTPVLNNAFLLVSEDESGLGVLYNAITGKEVTRYTGSSFISYYPKFSPDNNSIFTACTDFTIKQWNKNSGKLQREFKGHTNFIVYYEVLKKLNRLITLGLDGALKVWDINNDSALFTLNLPNVNEGDEFSINAAGTKLVSRSTLHYSSKNIIIWDIAEGTKHKEISLPPITAKDVKISGDGKIIAVSGYDTVAYIIDAVTGKLLHTSQELGIDGSSIVFSPDNSKLLFFGSLTTKVMDVATGKIIGETKMNNEDRSPGKFNQDGSLFYTQSRDSSLHIYNTQNSTKVSSIGFKEGIPLVAFFDTKNRLITQSTDNKTRIWDIKNGTALHTFTGLMGSDVDMSGDTLVTAFNNEWLLYAIDKEKLIYRSLVLGNDNLVLDDKGRYDGNEAARKLIYFTCNTEIIELEQVKDQLWVPDLAARILKGDNINAKTLPELNICGLTPLVESKEQKDGAVLYKITPRSGGLGDIVLSVNNIEAKRYKPAQLVKKGNDYELKINKQDFKSSFISGGENPIMVKAYTASNTITSRGVITTEEKTKEQSVPPNLFAVMVGVSDYKGSELDLKYAAKDANDMSAAIANAAKKLLNTDGSEHVFMYNLTTEKENYQLPEKKAIKNIFEAIGKKAGPNDILLIFFAGHGIMHGDNKQFYFLTADASPASVTGAVADVGISTAELTEWMRPQHIKAQKRILIFDACNSGQAIKDFVKIGNADQNYLAARNDETAQQIKAIDKLNEKSGLFILSASASNQSAYEMGRYSQGLLTYSLLKAIKDQPEILEEGKYLNLSNWFNAAEKTVSDLSKESGARQEPQIVTNTNFNIGLVDEEVISKIILPGEKPLFTASVFFNNDESIGDDDLELSKIINRRLSEISSRGSESKIVYITGSNSPDAYTLTGRYDVKENAVTVKVNVKRNKEIRHRFEVKGVKNKLDELVDAITAKVAEIVK